MSVLTSGQLNRATLQRQLLLAREQLAPIDAVRRIVALQAQEAAAPYVALWNRVTDLDLGDVDRALSVRAVVKASLMRITLHAVAADDYPTFHAAVTPILRASRLNDRRFKDTGLSTDEADDALPGLLEYLAIPRTREEVIEYLVAGVSDEPRLWWALKTYAPILNSPTGALWTYGLELAYERAPDLDRPSYDDAVATLFRRYLAGYGPARAVDFAQFTLLSMSTINPIIEAIRDDLVVYNDTDGRELFDVADAPDIPDGTELAPVRLLGMWDSVLLAYRDRSRVVTDDIRPHVIRRNGDVLPTVLVDGHVAGTWRIVEDGIEIAAFTTFADHTWDELAIETKSLCATIAARDANLFSRADAWWPKLSANERRTLTPN